MIDSNDPVTLPAPVERRRRGRQRRWPRLLPGRLRTRVASPSRRPRWPSPGSTRSSGTAWSTTHGRRPWPVGCRQPTSSSLLEGFVDEREYGVWQAVIIALVGLSRLVDDDGARRLPEPSARSRRPCARIARRSITRRTGPDREAPRSADAHDGVARTGRGNTNSLPRALHRRSQRRVGRCRTALGSHDRRGRVGRHRRLRADARRIHHAATPQEQLRHLYALAEFDDAELVARTCELAMSDAVKTQNAPFLLRSTIANRHHGAASWEFVKAHWDEANERFPAQHDRPDGRRGEAPHGARSGRRCRPILRRASDRTGSPDARTDPRTTAGERGAADREQEAFATFLLDAQGERRDHRSSPLPHRRGALAAAACSGSDRADDPQPSNNDTGATDGGVPDCRCRRRPTSASRPQ